MSPCALAQAPQPRDARLSLDIAGGEVLAVMRFEGSATREATGAAVDRLKEALHAGMPSFKENSIFSWKVLASGISAAAAVRLMGCSLWLQMGYTLEERSWQAPSGWRSMAP